MPENSSWASNQLGKISPGGKAVVRQFERDLKQAIDNGDFNVAIVTGTAGTGKSTTLMRLALTYQSEGKEVIWINSDADFAAHEVRHAIRNSKADVVAIDDADQFGLATGGLLADIANDNPHSMILCGIRSTRLDRLEIETKLKSVKSFEFTIPYLEDSDINHLIDALTAANRLGKLSGLTRTQQIARFRDFAGRQLLVAMIGVTSGDKFEDRIDKECYELGTGDQGFIYATIALATSLRHFLTKDEIFSALGKPDNQVLNDVQTLLNRKLLTQSEGFQIRLRHRVVAERCIEYYKDQGQLREPLKGLLWAIATKVNPLSRAQSRELKLLKRLMNHDYMRRITDDPKTPREAYALVEDCLKWNYHYHLQRGSYEVEVGDVNMAKIFLDQARGIAPDDYLVQTEWAYMMIKRACLDAASPESPKQVEESFLELEDAIRRRGKDDSYPYHVLGSQGLSWSRRAPINKEERSKLLARLLRCIEAGVRCHPRNKDLQQLQVDLMKEQLGLLIGVN